MSNYSYDPTILINQNLFGYTPSLIASGILAALFTLLTFAHLYLVFKSKQWGLIMICLGGTLEIIGETGRIVCARNLTAFNGFLIQLLCLILAPVYLSNGIYQFTTLLVTKMGSKHSKLKRSQYFLWIFGFCDFCSIFVQGTGGGLASLAVNSFNGSTPEMGIHVMTIGIGLQLLTTTIFFYFFTDFYLRARKDPEFINSSIIERERISRTAKGIFLSMGMILLRAVYRAIKLGQGRFSYIITHEVWFFLLDEIPMVLVMASLLYCHPYFCLLRNVKESDSINESQLDSISVVKVESLENGNVEKEAVAEP